MKEIVFAAFLTTAPADFTAFTPEKPTPVRRVKTCHCSQVCVCGCNKTGNCTCRSYPALGPATMQYYRPVYSQFGNNRITTGVVPIYGRGPLFSGRGNCGPGG